jgi:O-antigen/teichoic acid export membrane protein
VRARGQYRSDSSRASLADNGLAVAVEVAERVNSRKAIRAGVFVIIGYGFSQALRLAGNLVLTRLLVPEMFAVMAIAQVFYIGVELLSDVGIGPAIIRSQRRNDPVFLNTAWTLQIVRGAAVWIVAAGLAWPVARIYGEPQLFSVLPLIGLNAFINGFASTSWVILQREMKQGALVGMQIVIQVVSLSVMALFAYFYRSIWSLVLGGLISALVRTVWSHLLKGHIRNHLVWEPEAARELLNFGRWILFSSTMMFLATRADRLLLGKLFPLAFFGVYSVAAELAGLPRDVMNGLSEKVLFPLSSTYVDLSRMEMRDRIRSQRRVLLLPLAVLTGLLGVFGDELVHLLYDARYAQASWIFPVLSVGMWPMILCGTIDRVFYVIGKPKYTAYGNIAKFVYTIVSIPLMYHLAGTVGVVAAVALGDIATYSVINYGLKREKLMLFKQDAVSTMALIIVLAAGIAFRLAIGIGLPGHRALGGP